MEKNLEEKFNEIIIAKENCDGCKYNLPSQIDHACITESFDDKAQTCENVFYSIYF